MEAITNAINNLPAELLGAAVWGIVVLIAGFVLRLIRNIPLLQKQVVLWKATIWGLVFSIAVVIIFGIIITLQTQQGPQNLTSYMTLNLTDDDVADFGWVDGDDNQAQNPSLAEVDIGDVKGKFVKYPVELRSVKRQTADYSDETLYAALERKLRNSERNSKGLLATLYIKSSEETTISVHPYLTIPNKGTLYLGFSVEVPTNHWVPVIWRDVADSTDYSTDHSEAFYNDLTAIRDKYIIPDFGILRLMQDMTVQKVDGSAIGFHFRLISDKKPGVEDVFSGEIYISSLTFLP
jgi:hypothetical protein